MDSLTNTTSTDTEPKTKESSVMDFTYLSLAELESQVVPLFPNEKDPEGHFHFDLLGAVIFRMVCDGWNKKELLDFVDSDLDYAIEQIAEWDKEDEEKVA
jgi:hypothetical protein